MLSSSDALRGVPTATKAQNRGSNPSFGRSRVLFLILKSGSASESVMKETTKKIAKDSARKMR